MGATSRAWTAKSLWSTCVHSLAEHLSSPPVFSGFALLDRFMWILCRSLLVLLSFLSFNHCVSVLLRFRDSDYPLCIFKLFLQCNVKVTKCCIAIYELLVLSEDLNSPPVLVWFALVNPRVSLWYFVNHCFVWFFLSYTSGHLRTSAATEFSHLY